MEDPINPLDLPEIRHLVKDHLPQADLARCLRVCRSWHAAFVPSVWRVVELGATRPSTDGKERRHSDFERTCADPRHNDLLHHRRYVETLILNGPGLKQIYHIEYPRLKSVVTHPNPPSWRSIPSLLSINKPIVDLNFRRPRVWFEPNPTRVKELLVAVRNAPWLINLSLQGWHIGKTSTIVLGQICQRLQSLKLEDCQLEYCYLKDCLLEDYPRPAGRESSLQRLDLKSTTGTTWTLLLDWIASHHRLKRVSVISTGMSVPRFVNCAAQGTWQELESCEIWDGLTRYQHKTPCKHAGSTKQSISISMMYNERPWFDFLSPWGLETLFDNLVSFSFEQNGPLTSTAAQQVMASCSDLETIKGRCVSGRDVFGDGRPWMCTGLAHLSLRFWVEGSAMERDHQAQDLFDRLSQLTRLQHLDTLMSCICKTCGPRPLCYTLENGLAKLASLTELESVKFSNVHPEDEGVTMSLSDCKWMVEHWKDIGTFAGKLPKNLPLEAQRLFEEIGARVDTACRHKFMTKQ